MTLDREDSKKRIREIKRHIVSLQTVRPYIHEPDEVNRLDQEIEECNRQINSILRQQKVRENIELKT